MKVRLSEECKKKMAANSADHVKEFENCIGTIVPKPDNVKDFPEVNVCWEPSNLKYLYLIEDLDFIQEEIPGITILKYENSMDEVNNSKGPVIFLAGPTVRGNQLHLISWRYEAVDFFAKIGFEGTLVIPEFSDRRMSDKDRPELPLWEYNGLKRADCILFWIPRTRELIALTTNWEHGLWVGREMNKVILGYPALGSVNSFRNSYIDIMWNELHRELGIKPVVYNTLEGTIFASIERAKKRNSWLNRLKKRKF